MDLRHLQMFKVIAEKGMRVAIMLKFATYHIPDDTVIQHIKDWKLHMPPGLITREVPLPQSICCGTTMDLLTTLIDGKAVKFVVISLNVQVRSDETNTQIVVNAFEEKTCLTCFF